MDGNSTDSSLLENVTEIITTTLSQSTTTTLPPSTSTSTTMGTTTVASTTTPFPDTSSSGIWLMTLVIFVVAVALIAKIIVSNRKRRGDLIGGTARWRLAASQQSGAGPARTAANYAPMGNNRTVGLEGAGPERALDWERQFFDEAAEPTEPSRLQLDFDRV